MMEDEVMEVRGRNLVTGLPKVVTVSSSETEQALRETTGQIVECSDERIGENSAGAVSRYS